MLLFRYEKKKHLQGYKAQNPLQTEIVSLTENNFQEIQQTVNLDYSTFLPEIVKSQCPSFK